MLPGIRWGSLRTKIIAWSFVPAAIILGAIALVGFYAYSSVTGDLVIERNQEVARLSAGQLADEATEYTDVLASLARSPALQEEDRAGRRTALEAAHNRLVVFDGGAILLDNHGIVVAAEPERPDIVGQDWSDRAYFRQMAEVPGPVFSDVVPDGAGGAPVIVAGVPIIGAQDTFRGGLLGMFRLGVSTGSSLYGSIVKLRLAGGEVAYLVDRHGQVIYHANTDRIGENFSGQSAVEQVVNGKTGALRTRDVAGHDIVASFAPVPGTPWGLVTEVTWEKLMAPSQSYRRFLLLLLALGLVIPAVVVAIGSRRLTRPIADLIAASQQVASGKFGQTIEARTGDELEELVGQFNAMSAQLSQSYTELRAREERLSLVLQGTSDGFWDWDLQTNQVYFSTRWKSMLGYADDEIQGKFECWRELLHPDDVEPTLSQLQGYLQGQVTVYAPEFRMRHKDGSYRWILARAIALRGADGKPYRMAGSHTDITDRKRADDALQERLAFEKLISDISTQFVNLGPGEIDSGIQHALEATGRFTGADRGYVVLLSGNGTSVSNIHEWCAPGIMPQRDRIQGQVSDIAPWTIERIKRTEIVNIPRVGDLPPEAAADKAAFQAEDTRSLLCVPMVYRGEAFGLVGLDSVKSERSWSDQNVALLKIVGEIFSNALEHKRAREAVQAAYQSLEHRVEERTQELAALNAIAALVSRSLDLREIMSDALDKTLEITATEFGGAYRLEEDGQEAAGEPSLICLSCRGLPEERTRFFEIVPLRGSAIEAATVQGGPLVWEVASAPNPPAMKQALESIGIRQVVSVPLMAKGRLVGALQLGTGAVRPFSSDQLSLLWAIGQQVGVAVENARLYQAEQDRRAEAERRRQVAEGLRDALAILNSQQSLDQTLQYITAQARQLLGSDAIALFRLDPEQRMLRIQAAEGLEPEYVAQMVVPVGKGAVGRTVLERRPVRVDDIASIAADLASLPIGPDVHRLAWLTATRYKTLVGVPLILKDEVYGALLLYYATVSDLSEEDTKLAAAFADQAALAIQNARLREQAGAAAAVAERNRLARELHDSVTQSLYSATLYAEAAARLLSSGDTYQAADHLRSLRDTAQEALREMRLLIFELRPPALEKTSLAEALEARLKAVEGRGGIQAELRVDGVERLPVSTKQELYQITQEALNNVLRHARAGQVTVALQFTDDHVRLEVCDDGVGFVPATAFEGGGQGLRSMRERAQRLGGTLDVASEPGKGTSVSMTVGIRGNSEALRETEGNSEGARTHTSSSEFP